MTKSCISFALIAAFALCVGFSAASSITSRARYNTERVYDFTVSEAKDRVSWRAFGREWRIQLLPSQVTEDDTDYFYGALEGDDSAVVSFALLPGTGLSGMIAARNQTWWISARPLEEKSADSVEEADLGVFMFREPLAEMVADAHVALPPLNEPPSLPAGAEETPEEAHARKRSPTTQYKVGIFFDQRWAQASNNPWASRADTLALFNDVNAIYRAAGLGTFQVVYGKQVTNAQPDISRMLSHFANTASQNIAMVRDASFTNYIWLVGQNVGGLAYVGTSCRPRQSQTLKTSVAGLVNYSRLWTIKTIAHELAHNRGGNHQFNNQCANGQTRGCQCSVMSYCFPNANNNPDGARNVFHSTTIGEMRAAGCY